MNLVAAADQAQAQPPRDLDAERVRGEKLVGELERKWKDADRAQRDQERTWRENIAFLEGMQWLRSNERGMVNVAGNIQKGRIRLTDNKLLDFARRLHARIDQVAYEPAVTCESDDPGDRKAAKVAHGGLRWFARAKHVNAEKRKAAWWIVATGTAYLEPYYDPNAGPLEPLPVLDEQGELVQEPAVGDDGQPIFTEEPVMDPATGQPAVDPFTQAPLLQQVPVMQPVLQEQPIGDVDFVVRSPFQVRRDPRFTDWRKIRWAFVDEIAAREEVVDRFSEAVPGLDGRLPKDGKFQTAPWIPSVPGATDDLTGIPKPLPTVEGTVTVRRYYERPSRAHPKGQHIIYLAGTSIVLHEGTLPKGQIPLFPLFYRERPWMLDGATPVTDSKILQRLINRIGSRFAEHLVRLPAGWLLVPTNSGIPKKGFTNESGAVIRHTPGAPPSFIFPPFQGLAWYDLFLKRLEASMEERMALPPAMRGQMPTGARAARTVELLQESADNIQAPVLNAIADAWAEFYGMVLDLMATHFTVGRLITIVGSDKAAETLEFKGQDIPANWRDRLQVKVEAGESLPSSRLARIEFILTLARVHQVFGQAGTPEYTRRLKDALDLDAGFIQTEADLDITIAEHENLTVLHGGAVHVRPIDDDDVHLREHLTYMKRLVAAGREEDGARLMPHVQEHHGRWMNKLAAAMAARQPHPLGQESQEDPTTTTPVPGTQGAVAA